MEKITDREFLIHLARCLEKDKREFARLAGLSHEIVRRKKKEIEQSCTGGDSPDDIRRQEASLAMALETLSLFAVREAECSRILGQVREHLTQHSGDPC
jgi:hypothetical protein